MLARTSLKGTVLIGSCRAAEWVPGGVLGGLETREVEGTMNAYWNGSSTYELDDGIWIRRCSELYDTKPRDRIEDAVRSRCR